MSNITQHIDLDGSATWIRTRDRPINSRNLINCYQRLVYGYSVKLAIVAQYVTGILSNRYHQSNQ